MRALYLTHNGLTEPLGQSQILPYVRGLADRGIDMDLVSFEPPGADPKVIDVQIEKLRGTRVHWHPLRRSASHRLRRKVFEASSGALLGLRQALMNRPRVVHARSYLPTAMAEMVRLLTPSARVVFDCRGMLGDEYVDCGHWRKDQLEYRLLKACESRFFQRADAVVVLTRALRSWLRAHGKVASDKPVHVVPCCADLGKFDATEEQRAASRSALGLGDDQLVITYSGSLGTWYLEDEMARFVARVQKLSPRAVWLVLTPGDAASLKARALAHGIAESSLLVRKVPPPQMSSMLAAGDLGLSFIQSCFSKMGSSPTKVAEYLAMGMPVVVNADIGDQRDLAVEANAAIAIEDFGDESLDAAAARAVSLAKVPYAQRRVATRDVATRHFGLIEVGITRYAALYQELQ